MIPFVVLPEAEAWRFFLPAFMRFDTLRPSRCRTLREGRIVYST